MDLAEKLGVSRDTVQRFEAGRPVDAIEEEVFLRRAAGACRLPYAFFTVDFARLSELDDTSLTVVHDETETAAVGEQLPPTIYTAIESAVTRALAAAGLSARPSDEAAAKRVPDRVPPDPGPRREDQVDAEQGGRQ